MTKNIKFFKNFLHLLLLILSIYHLNSQNVQTNNDTLSTSVVTYPIWLNSSQTRYQQFLTDSYNYFETPKGNRIWGCTMNLAWNQMKNQIFYGETVKLYDTNDLQQKMVDNLNAGLFDNSQLSQDSYYVRAGFGQGTVDKINAEVRQKFPTMTFLPLDYQLKQGDFLSYTYLFKKFNFQVPFTDSASFSFNGQSVRGFQTRSSKQRKQVYYKYYNNTRDFMVGIKTQNQIDEIMFWKTNQTGLNDIKFQKVLSMIDFYSSLPSLPIARIDRFSMPVLNLEYDRTYKELIQLRFANFGFTNYKIADMNEKLKIMVTKSGVILESQASVFGFLTSVFGAKSFALNSDFWLIMKQKNKKPYLVILVRNPSETFKI